MAATLADARYAHNCRLKKQPVPVRPNCKNVPFFCAVAAVVGLVAARRNVHKLRNLKWKELPIIKVFHKLLTEDVSQAWLARSAPRDSTKLRDKRQAPTVAVSSSRSQAIQPASQPQGQAQKKSVAQPATKPAPAPAAAPANAASKKKKKKNKKK